MESRRTLLLLAALPLLAAALMLPLPATGLAAGVAYGRLGDNLPSPRQVVSLMQANNIGRAMIYDTDQEVLEAFKGSNITLIVQVPNAGVEGLAASEEAAQAWVGANIVPYAPIIRYISVGNEVLTSSTGLAQSLLPAMANVYSALQAVNLGATIKVSTTHAANVLDPASFPPSNGHFSASLSPNMASILQFLAATGAPYMANVYPFLAYVGASPGEIDLSYALLEPTKATVEDTAAAGGNVAYGNLFDAQVDTFIYAMEKLGFGDVDLVVTETGWASSGDASATVENARAYNGNLVRHIASMGTPKRPHARLEVYIFALFNENQKTGAERERHFGLFNPDQTKVYDMPY